MLEIGTGHVLEDAGDQRRFTLARLEHELGARVLRRSLTVWQEHCSECAMPACYSSCAFYRPRLDYKCRRLDDVIRVHHSPKHIAIPITVAFGRWARLLGHGPSGLIDPDAAKRRESRTLSWDRASEHIVLSRGILAPVRRRLTNIISGPSDWETTDVQKLYFVAECENRATAAMRLTFSFALLQEGNLRGTETFKLSLTMEPGYSVVTLPVTKFIDRANLGRRFVIQIAPANPDERPILTFGLLDIAELSAAPTNARQPAESSSETTSLRSPAIKCVVWDLDNTLWTGTLVEDGLESLKLNDAAANAVRALDRKGILQSIASKNNFQDAQEALRKFNLDEYFLFPQISWDPKSGSIKRIRDRLNIGIDTFAFVDDQDFERAEVTTALPAVLAVDASQIGELMRHPRLDVPVTQEGSKRRMLYQAEAQREQAQSSFGSSYEDFLRSCAMSVAISRFAEQHLERVNELVQRTNQLNISTYRYSRDELCHLLSNQTQGSYVVHASDRFGDYGLVGFIVFDLQRDFILDMMFSCRIQGKLVDDAFLAWLFEFVVKHPPGQLRARFRASKKNDPARQLLERHRFVAHETEGDFTIWVKSTAGNKLDDIRKIITIDVSPDASSLRPLPPGTGNIRGTGHGIP